MQSLVLNLVLLSSKSRLTKPWFHTNIRREKNAKPQGPLRFGIFLLLKFSLQILADINLRFGLQVIFFTLLICPYFLKITNDSNQVIGMDIVGILFIWNFLLYLILFFSALLSWIKSHCSSLGFKENSVSQFTCITFNLINKKMHY